LIENLLSELEVRNTDFLFIFKFNLADYNELKLVGKFEQFYLQF